MNLILASASPRRRELLGTLGFPFTVRSSAAEELQEGPWMMLALENALRKAEEVAARFPDDLVIGADTVIEFEDRILGKPKDLEDAFRMLSLFSGRTHSVTTGCAIRCLSRSIRIRFAETSQVTFHRLNPETIRVISRWFRFSTRPEPTPFRIMERCWSNRWRGALTM